MSISLLFWLLMTLWLVLGGLFYARDSGRNWFGIGTTVLPWVAVALVGWQVFGPIVQK